MRGIDVSRWNGYPFNATTSEAYKASDFVICKASQGSSYIYTDIFKKQISKVLADGKLGGAYHYAAGGDAVKEADFFVSVVKPYVGKIILALDWERGGNAKFGNSTWCKSFIARVKEKTGVQCFLYTGMEGIAHNTALAATTPLWFAGYPLNNNSWTVPAWPARYKITPWKSYTIWQYSGNTVDRNTSGITKAKWLQLAAKATVKKEEAKANVVVKVGSARIDENGRAHGGVAGDQTGKEVAVENWYRHSLGWVVCRAKTATMREKLAKDMEYACANNKIGYDQYQNTSLWNVVKPLNFDCSKVTTACETDCARLVRVCCWYAGSKPADFYTGTLVAALKATGDFDVLTADKYCNSSDYLMRGDILCTKTKGHVVIVLNNGAKVASLVPTPAPKPAATDLKVYQKFLNDNYAALVKGINGALLTVDGKYGYKTRAASVAVWKHMANKYYKASLTLTNSNFLGSCMAVAKKMTDAEIRKHPTLIFIMQGVLAGLGAYTGTVDGKWGNVTTAAIKSFQASRKLSQTGSMSAATWYAMFN